MSVLLVFLCYAITAGAFHNRVFLGSQSIAISSARSPISVLRAMSDSIIDEDSSVSKFSGAGPVQVDMNIYNLPFETVLEEWTANMVPATPMQEEGIYLGAKNSREHLVDVVQVEFPRLQDMGLGIQLMELAGGREDSLGITIVEGLVEGGSAENSDILPGDCITKVAVRKSSSTSAPVDITAGMDLTETVEESAVTTECLGYDATVSAIVSLPPVSSEGETFVLTLKRLRRKPKINLTLQYPPEMNEPDVKLELFAGENLRRSMLVKGVKLNDALSRRFDSGGIGDCGAEGTCATCAVKIVQGGNLCNPRAQQEAQILVKRANWRMSCKTIVGYGMKEGSMTVRVSPRQWADGS